MQNFIDYLERMIDGCDSLGGMEREKAIYQSVLKEYRLRYNVAGVSNRISQDQIKEFRKEGRLSGATKDERFYKMIARFFEERYDETDFTVLYDC